MPLRDGRCPPDETWAAFPGRVSGEEHEALLGHLATCTACRLIVAELARQGVVAQVATLPPDDASAATAPASIARPVPGEVTRLGRFVVLDLLGEGGMGTVLSAYDPRLERKVALKVLRDATGTPADGHARLLREAQALARIAHPHVVPIHEVVELDGHVVLVMEYVAGRTLNDWLRAERPPWQVIVATYLQAGRGLAAAHAAGLVHRDFKPSNALIGADGRVRVIDFGLVRKDAVRAADTGAVPNVAVAATAASNASAEPLTETGTLLGTPAYMAPEQFARADVGPRTDIYAFCASLCEALYGVRPFPRGRPGFAAGEGTEPPAPAPIPRRIWTVLRRGLSAAPEQRHASLDALIRELEALVAPSPRRRIAAAAVALTGAAIATVVLLRGEPGEAPCSGGAAQIATIWDGAAGDRLARQLSSALGAYGTEVALRVVGALDRYAGDWTAAHHAACMAHRRGEQSAALLDKRMHCLDRHRAALASVVALLGTGDAAVSDPVRLVVGLPSLSPCDRLDLLEGAEPPPADPAARLQLATLERALEHAAALERSGDYRGAGTVAAGVLHDAPAFARSRLEAAANLQLGRAHLLAGELGAAGTPLRSAQHSAIAADTPEIAVEAIARRIYAEGLTGALELSTVVELRGLAEAFLARARDGAFARALLLNNVGVIHRAQGQRDAARAALREALAARAAVARPELELGAIVENLATVTDDAGERQALFERSVQETEAILGPHHPEALRARLVQASWIAAPRARRDRLDGACAAWHELHPSMTLDRGLCEQALAVAEQELGHRDQAAARFAQAATLHAAASRQQRADIARGHAEQLAGHAELARAALDAAAARSGPAPTRPWEIAQRAEIDAVRAELAMQLGQADEAMRHADRAVTALGGLDVRDQLAWQVIAARAQVTAAIARLGLGGQARRAEAATLLAAAARWYRAAGDGYEGRLRDIAEWQASAATR